MCYSFHYSRIPFTSLLDTRFYLYSCIVVSILINTIFLIVILLKSHWIFGNIGFHWKFEKLNFEIVKSPYFIWSNWIFSKTGNNNLVDDLISKLYVFVFNEISILYIHIKITLFMVRDQTYLGSVGFPYVGMNLLQMYDFNWN